MHWRALDLSSTRNTRKPLGRSREHEAAWRWTHIPLKSLKGISERLMAAPHKTPEKKEWIHLPREKQWSWALYRRSYGERAENSTQQCCHPSAFLTIWDAIAAGWNSLHTLFWKIQAQQNTFSVSPKHSAWFSVTTYHCVSQKAACTNSS